MLVEIPDLVVRGSLVFLVGLLGAFLFYRATVYASVKRGRLEKKYEERLNYYEKMLVDVKIQLDALSVGGIKQGSKAPARTSEEKPAPQSGSTLGYTTGEVASSSSAALTNHTLQLVTKKPMTSRDIQITIGRTREHTARLMKRLTDEGLVERKAGTRPYLYSITEKGVKHLENEGAPAL